MKQKWIIFFSMKSDKKLIITAGIGKETHGKKKIIINFTLRNFMVKSNRRSIKTEDQDGNKHFIKLPIFATFKTNFYTKMINNLWKFEVVVNIWKFRCICKCVGRVYNIHYKRCICKKICNVGKYGHIGAWYENIDNFRCQIKE